MIARRYLILLALAVPLYLSADVYRMGMPKAGTHLFTKLIDLLRLDIKSLPHPDNVNREVNFVRSHPNDTILFHMRDPRDLLVSMYDGNSELPMEMRAQGTNWAYFAESAATKTRWEHMTRDERLMSMINMTPDCALKSWIYVRCFTIASTCRHSRNVKIVRYEDMVGPKGGGTRKNQKNLYQYLCKIANGDASKLDYALENSYGGTPTYTNGPREGNERGQIGRWRRYFNEEHIAAFKRHPFWNKVLLEFGYESTPNWH